jgi:hypothetical protein
VSTTRRPALHMPAVNIPRSTNPVMSSHRPEQGVGPRPGIEPLPPCASNRGYQLCSAVRPCLTGMLGAVMIIGLTPASVRGVTAAAGQGASVHYRVRIDADARAASISANFPAGSG